MEKEITTLDELWQALLKGDISPADAAKMLDVGGRFKRTIDLFLNRDSVYPPYQCDDNDMLALTSLVNILQYIYNNTKIESPVSDSDYDKLYEMMNFETGKEIITVPINNGGRKIVHHTYPSLRGTLAKVYYLHNSYKRTNPSRKYLDEWVKQKERDYEDKTGHTIDLYKEDVYLFPKWDGVSGIQECDKDGKTIRWLTRGDTSRNEASYITSQLDKYDSSGMNLSQPHGVKYEIMMENDKKDEYNATYRTDYKNSRSIVSSIINALEKDERVNYLHPVPLRYRTESGEEGLHPKVFEYPYERCKLGDIDKIEEFANSHRLVNGLRTDGCVIYIINPEVQKVLGRENEKNNYEVAYKFTEESAISVLEDIEYSVRNFGRITPVAIVKPVKLKGNTITRISLGNRERMESLNLHRGDYVKVLYDIIPYMVIDKECEEKNKELPWDNPKIDFPDYCPECGAHLKVDGPIAKCENSNCPSKITGKILNYLTKLKIQNISYAIVDTLHDSHFLNSIEDLYELSSKIDEICRLPGMGELKISSIIQEIENKRKMYDYEMFGSLGIEGISIKTFKKILHDFTVDDVMDICKKEKAGKLCKVPGIKEKSANKIIEGVNENRKLIKFLLKELDIISSYDMDDDSPECVFTKVRDADFEKELSENGWVVADSVTDNTKVVVVPDITTISNKVIKARKKNIPVITLESFKRDYKKIGK